MSADSTDRRAGDRPPEPRPPAVHPDDELSESGTDAERAVREYAQLLRLQERLLVFVQQARDELDAPAVGQIMRMIRQRTGNAPEDALAEVITAVEEALRALKMFEADIRKDSQAEPERIEVEGVPNLPPTLARFLAERSDLPGFTCEVADDPVRGWIIRWKEFTEEGTVRGSGQFYERPYAWLED